MNHRVLMLALSITAACTRSTESIEETFQKKTGTFLRLRDAILAEPTCDALWTDHYEWTDACNTGPCEGAPPPPKTGRPPGVAAEACEWQPGCGRWVDRPPTAKILASICGMSIERAHEYLEGMRQIGALRLIRSRVPGDDDVVFVMSFTGMVSAGTETDIVWRTTPPVLRTGTHSKGAEYAPLASGWWRKKEWN